MSDKKVSETLGKVALLLSEAEKLLREVPEAGDPEGLLEAVEQAAQRTRYMLFESLGGVDVLIADFVDRMAK